MRNSILIKKFLKYRNELIFLTNIYKNKSGLKYVSVSLNLNTYLVIKYSRFVLCYVQAIKMLFFSDIASQLAGHNTLSYLAFKYGLLTFVLSHIFACILMSIRCIDPPNTDPALSDVGDRCLYLCEVVVDQPYASQIPKKICNEN